ncbi:hypothetical protein [Cerasicoccus maritimus]|uniref:hypothetical protein n=1 Tax=Cerasicoccus maritimus TaxID=490089 RepID=UPI00285257D1|nr:hypothetical protein [Cerasicoccus maritimus]
MHRFLRITLALCTLATVLNPLGAAPINQEEPNVSIQFTTLSWDATVIKDLKFESDGEVESVSIYKRGFSIPQMYHGPRNMRFFREVIDPATGATLRKTIAQVNIPESTKELLLIFKQSGQGANERYQIFPIKRDRNNFPRGSYQIFNLSDYHISGKIDEQLFQIDTQRSQIIKLPLQKTTTIDVKFARNENDAWSLAYSSLWAHKANNRVNIFIFNTGDEIDPIEIRMYKEFLPAPPVAQQ